MPTLSLACRSLKRQRRLVSLIICRIYHWQGSMNLYFGHNLECDDGMITQDRTGMK